MWRRALLLACFAALAAGAARADDAAPEPATAPAASLVADVAALRGLQPRRPVASEVATRADIRARLVAELEGGAPGELAAEGRALARFGLIPLSADYRQLFADASMEQIAGFYDPGARTLFVADDVDLAPGAAGQPASDGRLVVAHEVAHALVDQHFGLESFLAATSGGLDGDMARRAVVEGDASATMVEFMFAVQGLPPPWGDRVSMDRIGAALRGAPPAGTAVPLWLRAHAAFPYLQGFQFVADIRRTRSWRAVDDVYRRPPLTTEHVLHPRKYAAYEPPVAVAAADVVGAERMFDTTIGELGVRTLVRHHGVSAERAAEAAEGWGGDRLALYELAPAGAAVGALMTEWDTDIDAAEFFAAAGQVARSLCATLDSDLRDDAVRAIHVLGWTCTAERRGARVLVTVGAPWPRAEELAAALWAGESG